MIKRQYLTASEKEFIFDFYNKKETVSNIVRKFNDIKNGGKLVTYNGIYHLIERYKYRFSNPGNVDLMVINKESPSFKFKQPNLSNHDKEFIRISYKNSDNINANTNYLNKLNDNGKTVRNKVVYDFINHINQSEMKKRIKNDKYIEIRKFSNLLLKMDKDGWNKGTKRNSCKDGKKILPKYQE